MARIIVTTSASADQAAILKHLHAKAGLGTLVKFRSLFGALYDRLADHPASGPRRTALGSNIRIGIVSPYIVIYRHSEGVNGCRDPRIDGAATVTCASAQDSCGL
jgi:toxin ParE1/3/4